MSLLVIILLVVVGIILFLIEFLLIPGVTIGGIGGAVLMGFGIYLSYTLYGGKIGTITLVGSFLASLLILGWSLRAKTWSKFALTESVDGKSNEDMVDEKVKPGDIGKTVTRLAPSGNIMINGLITEARSTGDYIRENSDVVVLKIENSKLIVKPKI